MFTQEQIKHLKADAATTMKNHAPCSAQYNVAQALLAQLNAPPPQPGQPEGCNLPARDESLDHILAAVGRGWCAPVNANKVLDYDLALAIAREVGAALAASPANPVPALRKLTLELDLKELAAEFAACANNGWDVTISSGVCARLFIAMTSPPDAAPVASAGQDRNAVLEEAAVICDGYAPANRNYADICANEIRALKSTAPVPAPQHGTASEDAARDWSEDYAGGENQYECRCSTCQQEFFGHKRRVTCKACAALAVPAPAAATEDLPVELIGVKEQLDENAGFWHSCSGCYETEDGHPVGNYAYSAAMRCALGNGCAECGGLGAVWDNNDYDAMHREMEAERAPPAPAPVAAQGPSTPATEAVKSKVMGLMELRGFFADVPHKQVRIFGMELLDTIGAAMPSPQADNVAAMVDRFLGWKLPKDFYPDCGISFDGRKDDEWSKDKTWPTGTNLLRAGQAKAMFEYCLASQQAAPVAIAEGMALVPIKITPEMIERGIEAHYGKRRVQQVGGARGVSMAVNGTDYSGVEAMRNFWKGALAASPAAPDQQTSTDGKAGGVPAGVTLKAFKGADTKEWHITIQHPFGTSWVRMGQPRDVKLAELIAARPTASAAPDQQGEALDAADPKAGA